MKLKFLTEKASSRTATPKKQRERVKPARSKITDKSAKVENIKLKFLTEKAPSRTATAKKQRERVKPARSKLTDKPAEVENIKLKFLTEKASSRTATPKKQRERVKPARNFELKMASEDFKVNDVIWAKMKGYPVWPAKISRPFDAKSPQNEKCYFVYFFGTHNYAWIPERNIIPHSESILNNDGNKKAFTFQKAIGELLLFLKSTQKSKKGKAIISIKDENINEKEKDIPKSKIVPKEKDVTCKEEKEISKKAGNGEKKSKKKISTSSKKPIRKRPLDIEIKEELDECTSPKHQKLITENLIVHSTPDFLNSGTNVSIWGKDNVPLLDYVTDGPGYFNIVQRQHLSPTEKKIGFIGLGNIGSAVVENLLKSGHNVTVWNKTSYKCEALVSIGARIAHSPADVIVACDITFCCVSDPDASKAIIFGYNGVIKGLEQAQNIDNVSRGYVEMTSIDPETSRFIDSVIARKGGKYLEAPIYGNNRCAADGTLLILASGAKDLFLECATCFHTIGKHAYFLSCNVGYGSEMSLLLRAFSGTVYAAVAETLILAERLGLEEEKLLTFLGLGPLQCQNIIEKCRRMMKSDFKTVTPLKHVQKNLDITLSLGNKFSQRMHVTAAANEVYKHAKLLKYSDLDVSAVYQGVRY